MSSKPSLWNTLENDPEVAHLIRGPLRLARGVRVFPHKEGIVLAGGPTTELFSGYGARVLLGRLLPLLDGTRTVAEIEAANDVESHQVRETVANLFMSGLLRVGPIEGEYGETEIYLDRLIGHTGAHHSGAEAAASLRGRSIALAGGTEALKALFEETGGGRAVLMDPADEIAAGVDLLLVISTPGSPDPEPLFARANRAGIEAINIEISRAGARIGPHVMAQRTASYACYRAVHTPLTAEAGDEVPAYALRFWSAFALHIATATLARAVKLPSFNAFTEYRWEKNRQVETRTSLARLHGWAADGTPYPLPLRPGQPGYEGWKQYCSVALQASEAAAPNAYLVHYKAENIRSIYERVPAIYSDSVVPLPAVWNAPSVAALAAPAEGRMSLATLAAVATHVAGFGERDGMPQRMAPTGGNLGSTLAVFLVRDVEGIDPGAYWFDSQKHVFERVPNFDEAEFSANFGFDPGLPAVLLTFGNIAKVARKYGAFSFNICWYDSGVMLAYARNLGEALGVELVDYPRPDQDELLDSLGLPSSTLIGTGALGLRVTGAADAGKIDSVVGTMRRRRGVRAWSRADVSTADLVRVLESADSSLGRYGTISGQSLNLSMLVAAKLSDGVDGIYLYRDSRLDLLAPLPREQHARLLSQTRLTECPLIFFPNVDLGSVLAAAGDAGVETAYKAAGSVVGEMWLGSEAIGFAGTACGGAFDGDIRSITGRHGLEHFAPLALCLGPMGEGVEAESPSGAAISA